MILLISVMLKKDYCSRRRSLRRQGISSRVIDDAYDHIISLFTFCNFTQDSNNIVFDASFDFSWISACRAFYARGLPFTFHNDILET